MLDVPVHVGSGAKIVLVHGFTQSGEVWRDIATHLADSGYEVLAPSLPGHGETPAQHDNSTLPEAAALLVETCGLATYVGYSLGARVLRHVARNHAECVQGFVAVGPRATLQKTDRAERLAADLQTADEIESDLDAFIDRWMALEFNQRIPFKRRHQELRRRSRASGLAASIRNTGLGSQSIDNSAGGVPGLFLVGEYDMAPVKQSADDLVGATPGSELKVVAGAGHALAFEMEPERFAAIIDDYCRRL